MLFSFIKKVTGVFGPGESVETRQVAIPRCEQLEERVLLSLLGIANEIGLPATAYDSGGSMSYDADTQAYDAAAVPLAILGVGPIPIIFPFPATPDIQLHIVVDNSGNLVGGVAGDDLSITGNIDFDGNPGNGFEYSGVLLTGEIVAFGYLDSGDTDQYDFRLVPTGGLLVDGVASNPVNYFLGKDIGMTMTSINSSFNETGEGFGVDFTGFAAGTVGPIEPVQLSSLSGFVYEDANSDGEIGANEYAIPGVTVTLTGVDNAGQAVNIVQTTDSDGNYMFVDLQPGTYTISETQPGEYADNIDTVGSLGGVLGNDVISQIVLGAGQDGDNYNFGEQANSLAEGQTATIGFWQNKNGQRLLKSLNGGENATLLGTWLAETFPNLYGTGSNNNLSGLTNKGVAEFYRARFKTKTKELRKQGITNCPKLECQVMAAAFASYVTSLTLAGNVAASYGFLVTTNGVGAALFNIGDNGMELLGVADYSNVLIMDILQSTNDAVVDGDLYGLDALLRALANQVYTAINEGGDLS